jgi:hypothetical protein
MKDGAWLGGLLALGWIMAGCTTTGDPRQGGLFGWSEAKAQDRQKEREARVAGAEAELAHTDGQSRALEARASRTDHQLATARSENERAEEKLSAQQAALLAMIDRLETESPTPALASRARSYRLKVNTIAAQTALPSAQRSSRLHALEVEINAALEQNKR